MAPSYRYFASVPIALVFLTLAAHAQIVNATVDILSPGDEGYDGIPPNLLVLDIFVDVALTDVWTASGTRMTTDHGATFVYFDGDPNTPATEPGLFNPGVDDRFTTSLSRPRPRNAEARFQNAGAAAAGAYSTPSGYADVSPTSLDVAYFASPPMTSGAPSVDGYIARIALDLSDTPYQPADLVVTHTLPEVVVLQCLVPFFPSLPGFAYATFDAPQLGGMNFWVTVPEPATLALLLGGTALAVKRRE